MTTICTTETARVIALIDNRTNAVWYMSRAQSFKRACEYVALATSENVPATGLGFMGTTELSPDDAGYSIHDATGLPPSANPREEWDIVRRAKLLAKYRLVS
jgi:hypothetical protein